MANKFLGVGVNFGLASTGFTGSGIGTFKLQDNDHSKKAKTEDIQDENGRTVQRSVFDESEEATFEYIPSGSTTALAVAASTIPDIGTLATVTDTTNYTAIAGTNWIVADVTTKRTNKGALKVTLKLERFPGITAVTS